MALAEGDAVEFRTHQDAHRRPADRQWWPATYQRPGLPKHHVVEVDGRTVQVHRDDLRRAKEETP